MATLKMFQAAIAFVEADLEYSRVIRQVVGLKPDGSRVLSASDWRSIRTARRKSHDLEQAMFTAFSGTDMARPDSAALSTPRSPDVTSPELPD